MLVAATVMIVLQRFVILNEGPCGTEPRIREPATAFAAALPVLLWVGNSFQSV
jgi:hypothetical protein